MSRLVLALLLALSFAPAFSPDARAGEVLDFGDPLPLPPPPIDDSPAPPATTLTDALPPLFAPPALSTTPPATPAAPSLAGNTPAPLPLAPPAVDSNDVATIDLPGRVDIPAAAPAAQPAADEKPLAARVNGGRVNVRAGPNTQYESVAVLTTGAPVTVLAKHGDWYKIAFPADQLASIHKNYVTADITGEIPEEGIQGVVSLDNAEVHAFYWDKSTVVGSLKKGDIVTIKQERGQWYRIVAPESARAFVFAQYVKLDGGDAVPADMAAAPVNPAVDITAGTPDATGRLKLSENDRKAAALKEAHFARLREQEQRRQEEEVRQVSQLEEALSNFEARLSAIDAEISSSLSYPVQTTLIGSAAWAPPDPAYGGFTGWIENIGRVGGAPANFRLTKGGEIRFFLRSSRFNLGDFVGARVWLNGNIELAAGAYANVLNVEQIRVLTEVEIAEGMVRQPAAPGAPAAAQQPGYNANQYQQPGLIVTDSFQPGVIISDPFPSQSYGSSDPYAGTPYAGTPYAGTQYDPYASSAPTATYGSPIIVTNPSALPDHIGAGQSQGIITYQSSGIMPLEPTYGEVDSDYYESPFISEIGP